MYRVKQFIWAITGAVKSVDYELVEKYLDKEEMFIFKKLKKSEQHHCIRVCNDAIQMLKDHNKKLEIETSNKTQEETTLSINQYKLGKIALLHDVGKSIFPITIIDKSIIVILDKLTKGRLRNYDKYEKVNSYYNHPIRGVKILSQLKKYDNEFLDIIGNHHKDLNENDNLYLSIIKKCDDMN
ncbi:HD domain-containing protein [Clostridium thermobutyricum]|uniref:HD domain-containing protein n=1 Tax=Clostridium thermobutyricum TaxID=29372 RepID=UPI0018AAEEEE|nr:HD domain-containing protein [Clostridium thermobutyricum]